MQSHHMKVQFDKIKLKRYFKSPHHLRPTVVSYLSRLPVEFNPMVPEIHIELKVPAHDKIHTAADESTRCGCDIYIGENSVAPKIVLSDDFYLHIWADASAGIRS